MTNQDLTNKIEKAIEELDILNDDVYTYEYFGLRFENKNRTIGEICECSKHNSDREDERDFPEYGESGYDEMEELDGTSAWDITGDWKDSFMECWSSLDSGIAVATDHCYIIAGNEKCTHDNADYNEIVIENAKVLKVIF